MKNLKMLGAAVVAAAALTALVGAGTAYADFICTENTTPCGKTITKLESSLIGGTVKIEGEGGVVYSTCSNSLLASNIEIEGVGKRASGKITTLTWTGCTAITKTLVHGSQTNESAAGTNGKVYGDETEITVNTLMGTCVYRLGTLVHIGTLLGGANAALAINAPFTKVSGPCTAKANWIGEYQITNHTAAYVHLS